MLSLGHWVAFFVFETYYLGSGRCFSLVIECDLVNSVHNLNNLQILAVKIVVKEKYQHLKVDFPGKSLDLDRIKNFENSS